MKLKFTLDISGYTDEWDMEERFDKFYDLLKQQRQLKTGGVVSRKAARKVFERHLKHVASYYMVECWDSMIDENIDHYLCRTDQLAEEIG